MAQDQNPEMLVPPAVFALRDGAGEGAQARCQMERTVSMDIREEREDLRKAAEESLNAIMDLNLDGTIRWVSPSWQELTGAPSDAVVGKAIADLIFDHKTAFADAIAAMKKDDTKSRIIRFAVKYTGPRVDAAFNEGDKKPDPVEESNTSHEEPLQEQLINLEAQGIMVYDRSSGEESHVS